MYVRGTGCISNHVGDCRAKQLIAELRFVRAHCNAANALFLGKLDIAAEHMSFQHVTTDVVLIQELFLHQLTYAVECGLCVRLALCRPRQAEGRFDPMQCRDFAIRQKETPSNFEKGLGQAMIQGQRN